MQTNIIPTLVREPAQQLQANIRLLTSSSLPADDLMENNPALKQLTRDCLEQTFHHAFKRNGIQEQRILQQILHNILTLRISISTSSSSSQELSVFLFEVQKRIVERWLGYEIELLRVEAMNAPKDKDSFIDWFYKLCQNHPAATHPLFDYLAEEATRQDLEFFMRQECSVDPRFDDMLALAQVGISGQSKLEFFHNLSDEMGHGNPERVHTTMFSQVLNYLGISGVREDELLWQSLACGNMMTILCLHRVYHHLCIGYLGVTEALVPQRFAKLLQGAKRMEIPEEKLVYHLEHCTVDEEHTQGWLTNVISPAIVENPHAAVDIVLGVLLRLKLSQDYCDAILEFLNG